MDKELSVRVVDNVKEIVLKYYLLNYHYNGESHYWQRNEDQIVIKSA